MTAGYVEEQLDNRQSNSDELDLFDLWDDIVENKKWVVIGLAGCLLLAVAYLYKATSIYQSQVVIKSASDIYLLELNQPQLKASTAEVEDKVIRFDAIYELSVNQAYSEAQKALLSKEYRKAFFEDYLDSIKTFPGVFNENLLLAQNFAEFDKLFGFSVSDDKKDTERFSKLTFEFPDAEKSAGLLNQYAEYSLARKLDEIKETLVSKLDAEISRLEYEADKLRESYSGERNRQLLLLNEALQVAKEIGLNQPAFDKNQVLTEEPPLYMYGTKALGAEIEAIKSRSGLAKSLSFGEEYYVQGLPEILYRIDQLKKLDIDYDKVKLALIDEYAVIPTKPVKPRKLLIVALAVVAGLFGGIMLALIMAAFKRHKEARRRRALKRLEKKNG